MPVLETLVLVLGTVLGTNVVTYCVGERRCNNMFNSMIELQKEHEIEAQRKLKSCQEKACSLIENCEKRTHEMFPVFREVLEDMHVKFLEDHRAHLRHQEEERVIQSNYLSQEIHQQIHEQIHELRTIVSEGEQKHLDKLMELNEDSESEMHKTRDAMHKLQNELSAIKTDQQSFSAKLTALDNRLSTYCKACLRD